MFVSYSMRNEGYGCMCFRDGDSIFEIHKFLENRIISKVSIIFTSNYSKRKTNNIFMHTNKIYRLRKIKKYIRNAEEMNALYLYLYNRYGFTNILGYY